MRPLAKRDPKSIGGYTLIGRLGAGGMGVVYLASKGSESVALKVVRDSLIEDDAQLARFKREIATLESINHPNIARILDSGVDGEQAWFAAEFANGPDLSARVKDKGPLDEDEWWTLAEGLMSALAAVHAAGVIHRDVKPSNVILTEAGPKLIDFGIAHVSNATSVTSTGMVAGSPAWFSPEQIEGFDLTPATDVFSAGSVLTLAATGSSPWGDETTMTKASVFKILTNEPNIQGLENVEREFVSRMLQKGPGDRPTAELCAEAAGSRSVPELPGAFYKSTATSVIPREAPPTKGSYSRMKADTGELSASSSYAKQPGSRATGAMAKQGRKRIASVGTGLVLAVTMAVIGVMHFQPASGPVTVYHYEEFSSANPVLGEMNLRITSGNRLPVEFSLESQHDISEPSTRTEIDAVTTWRANEDLVVELISSYSGDEPVKATAAVSATAISGLVRGNPAGISLRVTDTHFEIVVKAPTLDGTSVGFETVLTRKFSRGNEKQAIANCTIRRTNEMKREYADAISLGIDWTDAYEEAKLDTYESLSFYTWANRSEDYLSATSALLSNVERNSPIGIHPLLDEELNRVVARGEDNLEVTQEFIDFNRRNATNPGYDEDRWQDLVYESGRGARGFSVAPIRNAAKDLCGQEIE